jgi:D-alanine-D-alanine ligase
LFIKALDIPVDATVLDLCCGQGRHTIELARRGYKNLFGLDRSHYLINRAKTTARREGFTITFKEGDARKLSFPADQFDVVMIAGNSFGYFETVKDDLVVFSETRRVLKPGGKLLIDITDGDYTRDNFQARSWEWINKNYFVCRERSMCSKNERLISREVISHVQKGVIADQFYAERLYSREQITELLKKNQFQEIRFEDEIHTSSSRNQDLGMMAKRLIITSNVEKEWAPKKVEVVKQKTIAVLMGDHRKSDIIKPNSVFDSDDFHTINTLKAELSKLTDFSFQYLDSHDELVFKIMKMRNKIDFVFNLCDEGFNNEATKELHIPALLEILDISYSGGTPQCLSHCYDKSLVRGIASEMDIPVPKAFIIKPEDTTFIELQVEFPVIVKPNFGDSSFGITKDSVCHTIEELEQSILTLRSKVGYDKPILVEQFLEGEDISVGIIGNPPDAYQVLPIIEEDYGELPKDLPRICGYEAKWDQQSPYWKIKSIPANLSDETIRFLSASCVKLFQRLECRDYARFDWRVDKNGTPRLLEANPNPGWCWDGHLARMCEIAGINYGQMLHEILLATQKRLSVLKGQPVSSCGQLRN